MTWVGTGRVVSVVATVAGIGRVGIVALVAQVAIVGNGYVRAGEGINGIVVKGRGRPSGLGMAGRAIGWELLGGVVGGGGLIVVGAVATVAGVGGVGIITLVASVAVVGNWDMCADKRIDGVVVKSKGCPSRLGMALCAIGGDLLGGVVGIGGLGVIGSVAAVASIGGIVIIAVVTGGAVICDGGMRTAEWPVVGMLRESGGLPAGIGGVALRTVGRQV